MVSGLAWAVVGLLCESMILMMRRRRTVMINNGYDEDDDDVGCCCLMISIIDLFLVIYEELPFLLLAPLWRSKILALKTF